MKFISIPFVFLLLSGIFAGIVNLEVEFGKGDLSEVEVVQIGDTERGTSFSLGTRGNNWYSVQIDTLGYRGQTTIALDSNNQAHISYYDSSNNELKYSNFDGNKWSIDFIDPAGGYGAYPSIAIDNLNQPHMSYYGNGDLKYAYLKWMEWQTEMVDFVGDVGYHTSLALDSDNHPHISYYDNSNTDLKYAYHDGAEWQTEIVDSQGIVGSYTSIALDSQDLPHISYFDYTNYDLKYAFFDGSRWHNQTLDSNGNVGRYTSLAVDSNDRPHISYVDYSYSDLKYTAYDGTNWQTETVDLQGPHDAYTSIALDSNDRPHISYHDNSNRDLKYAIFDGSIWRTEIVDTEGGEASSLALDDKDIPHISYDCSTGGYGYYLKYTTLDYDPPILLSDKSPDFATTGDEFDFKISAWDITEVGEVYIDWAHGKKTGIENLSKSGEYWKSNVRLDHNLSKMTYTIYMDDIMGNRFNSSLQTVNITDNDLPVLEQPKHMQGYAGEPITFRIPIGDNIALERVHFAYWYGSGSYNYSVVNNSQNTWNITITAPTNELWFSYYFSAMDTSGNWADTPIYNIELYDIKAPVLLDDLTSGQPKTGKLFRIQMRAWDHFGISSVNLFYSSDVNTYVDDPMIYFYQHDFWESSITIPIDATYIYYYFIITDSNGNSLLTDIRNIDVLDKQKPVADAGKDRIIKQHESVIFDGSSSRDNMGIVSYNWTFVYDNETILLTGERLSFSFSSFGIYSVTLTVSDKAGNIAKDIMIVDVKDTTPPKANASLFGKHNFTEGWYIFPENQVVYLDGRGSTDNDLIDKYIWRFEEGRKQIEIKGYLRSYTFSQPGVYTVILTTYDRSGNSGSDIMKLDVLGDETDFEIPEEPAGNPSPVKEKETEKEKDYSFYIYLGILLLPLFLTIDILLVMRYRRRKIKTRVSIEDPDYTEQSYEQIDKYVRRRKHREKTRQTWEIPGDSIFSYSTWEWLGAPPEGPVNPRYSNANDGWQSSQVPGISIEKDPLPKSIDVGILNEDIEWDPIRIIQGRPIGARSVKKTIPVPILANPFDITKRQGCLNFYNMLLGKKKFKIKLSSDSTPDQIKKARRIIIKNYHPDKWQSDKDKATFLMKRINVAWDLLSKK